MAWRLHAKENARESVAYSVIANLVYIPSIRLTVCSMAEMANQWEVCYRIDYHLGGTD